MRSTRHKWALNAFEHPSQWLSLCDSPFFFVLSTWHHCSSYLIQPSLTFAAFLIGRKRKDTWASPSSNALGPPPHKVQGIIKNPNLEFPKAQLIHAAHQVSALSFFSFFFFKSTNVFINFFLKIFYEILL